MLGDISLAANCNKSEVKSITWQQFDWLMSGLDIEQSKAIKAAQKH